MGLLEILIGQLPEAIYFALFMIFTKRLKEKRLLFTLICALEYILLFSVLGSNVVAHIIFFIVTYCLLKILYHDKCQITDVFTLGIASIVLILICSVSYIIMSMFLPVYLLCAILNRIIMFAFLFLFRDKLYKITTLYKTLWNRNGNTSKKIKSTTFRSLNVVLFNVMFYVINLGMLCVWLYRR